MQDRGLLMHQMGPSVKHFYPNFYPDLLLSRAVARVAAGACNANLPGQRHTESLGREAEPESNRGSRETP